MTTAEIVEKIKSKKGHFASATWERPVKVLKRNTPAWAANILKRCESDNGANARAGITYDNLASVIEKRASGELPAENAGLPDWCEWKEFPYVLRHKTKGTEYIRLYPTDSVKVTYSVEGREISYEEIEEFLTSDEKRGGDKPDCIMVTLDNVLEVV